MSDENKHSEPEPPKANNLSEEAIRAIANQVAKSLKMKDYKAIAGQISKSFETKHYRLIGRNFAKSPLFLACFLFGIGTVCFELWKAVPHFIKERATTIFNKELTNQITLQFQEPLISNTVVAVASSEAKSILKKEIAPEITKFETNLREQIQNVQSNVASM